MKWSDLRYVSDVKEDSNAKEAIQAEGLAGKQVMRNGQNKRMRSRNRKGGHHQNPLSRMDESNGPE
jgi:hypothetical protein